MNMRKILTSPLSATAGVITGLALLAIPIRQLTSAPPVPVPTANLATTSEMVHAWLKLKILTPAKSMTLSNPAGDVIWKLAETPAGDMETDIELQLVEGTLDLTLHVEFGDQAGETAVFLTLIPDGLEEQTRHAIGSGSVEESLHFSWPIH
jgi:hypothetical protein